MTARGPGARPTTPSGPHRSASQPILIPTRARTSALGGYVTGHGNPCPGSHFARRPGGPRQARVTARRGSSVMSKILGSCPSALCRLVTAWTRMTAARALVLFTCQCGRRSCSKLILTFKVIAFRPTLDFARSPALWGSGGAMLTGLSQMMQFIFTTVFNVFTTDFHFFTPPPSILTTPPSFFTTYSQPRARSLLRTDTSRSAQILQPSTPPRPIHPAQPGPGGPNQTAPPRHPPRPVAAAQLMPLASSTSGRCQ